MDLVVTLVVPIMSLLFLVPEEFAMELVNLDGVTVTATNSRMVARLTLMWIYSIAEHVAQFVLLTISTEPVLEEVVLLVPVPLDGLTVITTNKLMAVKSTLP